MTPVNLKSLTDMALDLGLLLSDRQLNEFDMYFELLVEWNKKINLTAIEEEKDIVLKHFIDSLSILKYIPRQPVAPDRAKRNTAHTRAGNGAGADAGVGVSVDTDNLSVHSDADKIRFVDVGAGAGFPGIPVKIILDGENGGNRERRANSENGENNESCKSGELGGSGRSGESGGGGDCFEDGGRNGRSGIEVILLEAVGKKVKFMEEVIRTIGLRNVKPVHIRAEDAGHMVEYRGLADVAAARAVAPLPVLLEYSIPLLKINGIFIAMKSANETVDREISDSKNAANVLGCTIERVDRFCLPKSDISRSVIIVRKVGQTPAGYPRKAGRPSKSPL